MCFKKMDSIFSDNENVFCYVDTTSLATHHGFDNHTQQLDEMSSRLWTHNVQVHVEDAFLAASFFDYLGCRLTHGGIKPQEKKIKAMLSIAQPSNLRELRRFIGFVQHCRGMFRRRSDVLHPLTSAASNSIKKFTWTNEMNASFAGIKRVTSQN